ncbi:recombinase family protein [Vibrio parahaemolyticus]|nr:recombinase family protein [Vibrio parahaemolyticus]EHK9580014.1 recombinase family protein [Vibrio parahaemolyticus]EHK9583135.1 recombinase family protein [Vibrio parahaemolyticus]EIZ1548795.1 recombinase family protein [Vibrio parahaemolyticus]EJG0896282.1 recombinase family protein [Vibrio parahaemolyticus]
MSNFNMTPNQPPAKCYSYVRFSTVSQGKEGKDSYIRQTLAAKEYAARTGLEYQDKSFSDLGISGFRTSKKRDGLSSMLEAIQSGAIEPNSTICIDGFDRLSRASFEHTYDTVRLIVGTGVKLHVVQDNLTLDKSSLNDLISIVKVALQSDLAHKESAKKSYLIKQSRLRAREAHKVTGKLPMWISRVLDSKGEPTDQFVFNSFETCIRELVSLRVEGKSLQSIAKVLNNKEYKTSKGSPWSGAGVRSIIENRALYGAKSYHDTDSETGRMNLTPVDIVPNIFPALISFGLWQSIQQKSRSASTKTNKVSKRGAYSGLLRCGSCGAAMVMRTTTYTPKGTGAPEVRMYRKCIRSTEGSCGQVEIVREPETYIDMALSNLKYVTSEKRHVSKVPEIQEQITTLEKTEDILLQRGMAEKLADLYVKIDDLKSKLVDALKEDSRHTTPTETSFAKVIEIEDLEHRNMVLRKLLNGVYFTLLWKYKTQSKWKVTIEQINGLKTTFILSQKHGFGNSHIELLADPLRWTNLVQSDLEPWELDQY